MPHFKDPQGRVHFLESLDYLNLLPKGSVEISEQEAVPAKDVKAETVVQKKRERAEAVEQITVTSSVGNVFNGDERSQDRMARAVVAMGALDTLPWVLANNSVVMVTQAELREVLKLAGAAMAAEWVKPYAG